jgi:hypothetical protein
MTTLDVPQGSEAWFAARRGVPSCSRFDQIVTAVHGKRSAAQDSLIDELLAESLCPPDLGELGRPRMTAEMESGMKLEAEARCSYELEYATEPVREVGFILATCGLFGGSPDALVGETGGVEIKCPNASTHVGYVRGGTLPNQYRCQVHGYMIVTGRAWWDFFSYHRGIPPFRLRVERDEFTAKLNEELLTFCQRYNEARAAFKLPPLGPATEAAA